MRIEGPELEIIGRPRRGNGISSDAAVADAELLETPDVFEKAAPIQTDLYLLKVDLVPNRILDRGQLDSHGLDDRESLQSQVVHTEMPAILFGSVFRERSDPGRGTEGIEG